MKDYRYEPGFETVYRERTAIKRKHEIEAMRRELAEKYPSAFPLAEPKGVK